MYIDMVLLSTIALGPFKNKLIGWMLIKMAVDKNLPYFDDKTVIDKCHILKISSYFSQSFSWPLSNVIAVYESMKKRDWALLYYGQIFYATAWGDGLF